MSTATPNRQRAAQRSPIARGADGAANVITAAICKITGSRPARVCAAPVSRPVTLRPVGRYAPAGEPIARMADAMVVVDLPAP